MISGVLYNYTSARWWCWVTGGETSGHHLVLHDIFAPADEAIIIILWLITLTLLEVVISCLISFQSFAVVYVVYHPY